MINRDELTKEIKETQEGESFSLILSDDDRLEVGYADCWVGGDGMEGWMCGELGNVVYGSAEELSNAIFEYVEEDSLTIEEIDY